jgi:tRNA(fMet)-specific endonuclease VapC
MEQKSAGGLTMAVTHLLDTSVYSQPIKPTPNMEVMKRWKNLGDTALVTSAICEAEVLFGLRKKNAAQQLAAYETILKGRYDVLPVDSAVSAIYADLRCQCEKHGTPVADMDLLIAATAMANNNLIIATLNTKDFLAIKGIAVEDWSQP